MTPRRKRKLTLSKLFEHTQRLYVYLVGSVIICLGAFYLFMLNGVAMRGYVLTVEASEQQSLLQEIQLLDAAIAKRQSREYLTESKDVKFMATKETPRYVTVQQTYTAQKDDTYIGPNF